MNHFWERSRFAPRGRLTMRYVPSGSSSLALTLSARLTASMSSLMRAIISGSLTGKRTSTLARRFLGIMSDEPMYISGEPPFSK